MTIRGALSDLDNLLKADDIPFYYKPSIKAVMDTIALSSSEKPNNSTTKNDLGIECISRDSAIKALDYDIDSFEFKSGVSKYMNDIAKLLNTIYEIQVNNIKALPSVTPQNIDYKAQYERLSQKAEIVISQLRADRDRLMSLFSVTPQKPTSKNDLGVDCISRFEVTEILNSEYDIDKMLDRVDELPSVTPIRPKGHWIDTKENSTNTRGQIIHEVICSECNGIAYFRSIGNKYIGANICPNCGADMREVVEE